MKKAGAADKKNITILMIMGIVLIVVYLLSFSLGRYDVPVGKVISILFSSVYAEISGFFRNVLNLNIGADPQEIMGQFDTSMVSAVINVRFPRITVAALVGCCLATAGASYQGVFQNPMASPDILGASNGAAFGAAIAILMGGSAAMI